MVDLAANDAATLERAHVLDRDIKRVCRGVRTVWIHLAGDLREFHDDRCWEVLGYDTFEEWLGSPEVGLGRRQVFQLIAVHRELVGERDVQPDALEGLEVSKVAAVLPAITRGAVTVDEALSDVETLSRTDIKAKYRGDPHAPLDAEMEPEWHDCPDCGRPHKAKR